MTVSWDTDDRALDDIFGPEATYRVEVGFYSEYAAAVNYGGEPHWPPLTPMFHWTDRMGWENYEMSESMSEDEMWSYVDKRRSKNLPLPAAYLLAAHIASEGTRAMEYASDAFAQAQTDGEAWIERNKRDDWTAQDVAINFANWTLSMAEDNLLRRVSQASQGSAGLLGSAQPAELV